jgi:hypothetical protein
MSDMKRRAFITLLGGAAAAWPLAARAQQPAKRPIIGLVSIGASPTDLANFRPFLEQMRELGYVDEQNVSIDHAPNGHDDLANAVAGAAAATRSKYRYDSSLDWVAGPDYGKSDADAA